MQATQTPTAVLDDSEFYVEHNTNYPPDRGNGFLLRRCAYGRTTPGGYECVGGYELRTTGKWTADIHKPEDGDGSDITPLGEFDTQAEAIAALWGSRGEAYCRHPRY